MGYGVWRYVGGTIPNWNPRCKDGVYQLRTMQLIMDYQIFTSKKTPGRSVQFKCMQYQSVQIPKHCHHMQMYEECRASRLKPERAKSKSLLRSAVRLMLALSGFDDPQANPPETKTL